MSENQPTDEAARKIYEEYMILVSENDGWERWDALTKKDRDYWIAWHQERQP